MVLTRSHPQRLKLALGLVVILGAAWLSWLVPPIQSPDENAHFLRAYAIAQGQPLLLALPKGFEYATDSQEIVQIVERAKRMPGRMGGFIDVALLDFVDAHLALAGHPDKRLTQAEQERLAKLEWAGAKRFYLMPGTGYYLPAIYLPQAGAIAVGQAMHLTVLQSYRLARALTLLTCLVVLYLAFSIHRPSPLAVALLVLPMSLFQLLMPTIDGLTNCLAVLALSLYRHTVGSAPRLSFGASLSLSLCVFLLATSRTHLLPMLLLPLFVAWHGRWRWDVLLAGATTIAALAWTVFALQTTADPRIAREHTTQHLLAHYLLDPIDFLQIVFASLANTELSTFYERSFIGILGWLDTPLESYFYPLLWSGLLICAAASVPWSAGRRDGMTRVVLALAAVISVAMIFLALLVTWSPHPATTVVGVQGRYFMIPMLVLAYAVSPIQWSAPTALRRLGRVAVSVLALCSLTALTLALLSRYH